VAIPPLCSECGHELKTRGSILDRGSPDKLVFGTSFDPGGTRDRQTLYLGTICANCRTVRCDDCYPPSRPNRCPACNGELKPCYKMYL
jgi:hypothetical protein